MDALISGDLDGVRRCPFFAWVALDPAVANVRPMPISIDLADTV